VVIARCIAFYNLVYLTNYRFEIGKKLLTLEKSGVFFVVFLTTIMLLLMCLVFPEPALTESNELQKEIRKKKQQILKNKESIKELDSRERKLYTDISEFEKRIQLLGSKLAQNREELGDIKQEIQKLELKYEDLQKGIKENKQELVELIGHLWPLYLRRKHGSFGILGSWEKNHRQYKWLSAIFDYVKSKVEELKNQKVRLAENLEDQKRAQERKDQKIRDIRATKEELVNKKLAFLQKVKRVRAKKVAKKEQLNDIRSTIQDLQYDLKLKNTKKIANLKGLLPWPVKGKTIVDYNKNAAPPREGIGISLDAREPVKAVSWGEVVYDDTLRGFGEVIILFHGEQYYTLYAFLSDSKVKVGEKVEQSEIIGNAGFYPEAEGEGLYFEIRKGQQPIDPEPWLKDEG